MLRTETTAPQAAAQAPSATRAPRGRGWRLAQNLGLSCASLLIFVLGLEVILRALGYGQVELYRPDPTLYWVLAPDQHRFTKINHQPVVTDSHGTRGPEFALPKPPNTLRILSLGDSRTFGWGLSDAQTYSRLIQVALQRHLPPGERVEVINAGVDAWSFDQIRMFLRDTGLRWQPDLVLLGEGNLWTQFREGASPEFVRAFERRVQLKNLLRRSALYTFVVEVKLSRLYGKLRVRFIPVDPTNNPLGQSSLAEARPHFAEQIRGIADLLRERGVRGVFLYLPTREEVSGGPAFADGMVREIKAEVARAYGLPFLDLTDPMRQGGGAGLYLEGDPVHPNARGSLVIAASIADLLLQHPGMLIPGAAASPAASTAQLGAPARPWGT